TRLMNVASAQGAEAAATLRDWLVRSDACLDPQAYVLRPDVVVQLAQEIVQETSAYGRTRRAAQAALALLRRAYGDGDFALPPKEAAWLDRLSRQADALPEDEAELTDRMASLLDPEKIRVTEYLGAQPVV